MAVVAGVGIVVFGDGRRRLGFSDIDDRSGVEIGFVYSLGGAHG